MPQLHRSVLEFFLSSADTRQEPLEALEVRCKCHNKSSFYGVTKGMTIRHDLSSTNLQHGTFRQFGEERIKGDALFVNLASCGARKDVNFASSHLKLASSPKSTRYTRHLHPPGS